MSPKKLTTFAAMKRDQWRNSKYLFTGLVGCWARILVGWDRFMLGQQLRAEQARQAQATPPGETEP